MSSGLLSLKWNNHRSTFFHVLSSIRSKESYCDATLACDGRFYPVHKLVLSTCSEYFEQIFDRTQCKHPVIVLKDIRHDDLEALMNYMYVGEVNVMQEKLPGLIKAAECLKIKGLAVPDEDPSSIKDLRRNQHRNEIESPRAKRKRKDDYASSEERGRTFSSRDTPFSRVSHKEQLLETNINALHNKINSPHGSNALDDKVSESSYQKSLSKNQSGDEETGTSANESSISINDGTAKLITTKRLSETSIEETSVKSEPPDIIVPEEVDIKENIPVAFDYDPSDEGNSVTADDIDNGHDGEDSDYSNNVTESGHKNLDETTTQSLPSSSNNQANVFSMWEGESSSQNFPSEDFNRENSQGRSMNPSERFLRNCGFSSPWSSVIEVSGTKHGSYASTMTSSTFKRYQCDRCPYATYRKQDYSYHYRTHTGEKPYACVWCSYKSSVKSNLKVHVRRKHESTVLGNHET